MKLQLRFDVRLGHDSIGVAVGFGRFEAVAAVRRMPMARAEASQPALPSPARQLGRS